MNKNDKFAATLLSGLITILIESWVIWMLWPSSVGQIFHLSDITYWQSLCLYYICNSLFKSKS